MRGKTVTPAVTIRTNDKGPLLRPCGREIALGAVSGVSKKCVYLQNLSQKVFKCCSKIRTTMISFKPTVFAQRKRKDGTYPVSIRVTFARKSRYLPTTITVTAADLTRGFRIKAPAVIAQTNALCDRLRKEAARLDPFDLAGKDVAWVVAQLTDAMRAEDFRLDFFAWGEEVAATKQPSTGKRYRADRKSVV